MKGWTDRIWNSYGQHRALIVFITNEDICKTNLENLHWFLMIGGSHTCGLYTYIGYRVQYIRTNCSIVSKSLTCVYHNNSTENCKYDIHVSHSSVNKKWFMVMMLYIRVLHSRITCYNSFDARLICTKHPFSAHKSKNVKLRSKLHIEND